MYGHHSEMTENQCYTEVPQRSSRFQVTRIQPYKITLKFILLFLKINLYGVYMSLDSVHQRLGEVF